MKKILLLGFNLAIICAIAAGALAGVYALTKERIEKQIWEQQVKAARKVLPMAKKFKLSQEYLQKAKKDFPILDKIFIGYDSEGKIVGYAIQVLPRGYGGPITLMVGVAEDKVIGLEVVDLKETPGLGTGVLDKKWQKQFLGKTAQDQLEVRKDVDAISGATISSKAVTIGVKTSLEVVKSFSEGREQ